MACSVVFIGLPGAVLYRLIIGPGSLWRFYALFAVAFTAYSAGWIISRMVLRGNVWQPGWAVAWHVGDGLAALCGE